MTQFESTHAHLAGPGAVIVPAVSWIYTDAVLSIFGARLPPGSKRWFQQGGTFPDEKRNMSIRKLLEAPELQWAYFCDSDHVVQPDTVFKLLDTGLDVVGALYYGRMGRSTTPDGRQIAGHMVEAGGRGTVQRLGDVQARVNTATRNKSVCEVDWLGGGALLVRRHVLERVAAPWFFRKPEGGEDEDVYFCDKLRAAGFKLHLHGGAHVGHIQTTQVGLPSMLQSPKARDALVTEA